MYPSRHWKNRNVSQQYSTRQTPSGASASKPSNSPTNSFAPSSSTCSATPVRNPKGWPKEPLIKLLDRIESGWSPLCESRIAAADEWAILKLGAVTKCVFDPRENKAVLSGCVPRPDIEVKDGDVLFSRKNTYELVAACALVVNPPPRLMMSDLIFRLRIRDRRKLLPEYLWQVLIQPSLRGQIQALAGGSAGSMPNISKERLMSAVIPVPPADLQLQFAARLAKLNTLNARCADICAQAENLCVSLTDRAFHGRLSAQHWHG